MKTSVLLLGTLGLFWILNPAGAADPTPAQRGRPDRAAQRNQPDAAAPRGRTDPMGEHLFPPDLIMQSAQALDLTENQKQQMQGEMREMHDQMPGLQEQLKAENEKLTALLKPERVDEAGVLAQSDKVMDIEREMKRLQLGLLVRLKNMLTVEQQGQLTALKGKMAGVQGKMARAMMLVQMARQEGRDVSELQESREQLSSLMGQGKFKEAEALLDQVIEKLETKK